MPTPNVDRLGEYGRKAVELALRTVAMGPDLRVARRIRDTQPHREHDGPVVLFLSPRDWAEHVQYQGVIGQALRARGADVQFVTCGGGLAICDRANTYEAPPMPCTSCHHYVRTALDAHGFPLHRLSDDWADSDPWPELDEIGMRGLGGVVDAGLPLGRLVDIPLKWFLCAADLLDDPLAPPTTRAFLRSARSIAGSIAAVLDEVRPDIVVMLNGLFLFEAIAWQLCRQRSIDVVTYERAFLQETLVFSRETPAGFYDFSSDWAWARRPLTTPEEEELDGYLARRRRGQAFDQFWKPTNRTFVPGGGRLVALFTNLTWDTAVIGRDLAYPGIRDWLDDVIDVFAELPDHRLVIRVHPSEHHLPGKRTRDSLEQFVHSSRRTIPPNVQLIAATDPASSYPLMEECDIGLVYTSTTGLELALAGKPVIVAGQTHYRGKGFTIDVADPGGLRRELRRLLLDPHRDVVDVDLARQYAHFFFFRAPVASPGVREPLPGLARIDIRDAADLLPGKSADLDRICEGILRRVPFVR